MSFKEHASVQGMMGIIKPCMSCSETEKDDATLAASSAGAPSFIESSCSSEGQSDAQIPGMTESHGTKPECLCRKRPTQLRKSETKDVFKVPFAVRKKEKQDNRLGKCQTQEYQCRTPPPWIRPRKLTTLSIGNLLKDNSVHSPKVENSPEQRENVTLTPLLKTPNVELMPSLNATGLALTPFLKMHNMAVTPLIKTPSIPPMNGSDLDGSLDIENLSTPAIFQATRPDCGQMDLLTMIDDDSVGCEVVERKVQNYNEDLELVDSVVPDYIMDIVDDYKQNSGNWAQKVDCNKRDDTSYHQHNPESIETTSKNTLPVQTDAPDGNTSDWSRLRKGRFCKRMPQEMEKKIQSEQRNKNKMKRKRKPRLVESTEDCIKRRVNSGRRTRSLVKAAREYGLDIDSCMKKDPTEE